MLVLASLIHTSSAAMGMSPGLFCTVRGGTQQPSAFQRLMSVRGGMQVRHVPCWVDWRGGKGREDGAGARDGLGQTRLRVYAESKQMAVYINTLS